MSTNASAIPTTPPPPVSMGEAFKYWLTVGFLSFGGPLGQINMMHKDLVEKKRWISEHRFLHALSYCNVLPGPEAIQLAIYISWLMHGVRGAVMAGILFFLPAFFLLSFLAWVYINFGNTLLVQGIFYGMKPAVVAIILFAAWRIGNRVCKNSLLWSMAVLAFICTIVFAVFFPDRLSFPWIVVTAGILGAIGGKVLPTKFQSGGGHGASKKEFGPAIIDDHTPTPAHAKFSWEKLAITLAIFVVIWFVAMFAISGQQTLTDMGNFFTKAAFLTIGGAYAVLPYVREVGVDHFNWLTTEQMMNGLALGETTPGPLIMVVTWVGYLGGVAKGVLGNAVAGGIAGAIVATFFTFLPSFLFIIAGGPLVEATRNEMKFTAPLTGITAAVVGVIFNLAVYFAWHTFWPTGTATAPFLGVFEWFSVIVAIAAFVALWKYKIDIMKVIGVCALLGLAYSFIRLLLA